MSRKGNYGDNAQNWPGAKMDGNNDGVPCEMQWWGN